MAYFKQIQFIMHVFVLNLQSKKGLKYIGTSAPGPGVYGMPSMLRTQNDFNRSEVGRLFQKPIAHSTEQEKKEKRPAPNQYQVIINDIYM